MLIRKLIALLTLALVAAVFSAPSPAYPQVKGTYLYSLSNFTGTVPYSVPKIFIDKQRSEVYVLFQNLIRVFNENGMEIYSFGDDLDEGRIADATVDSEGNPLLLTYDSNLQYTIYRCNYRGIPVSKITMKGLSEKFADFKPGRMVYQVGKLYLASFTGQKIVVAGLDGTFLKGYDIAAILEEAGEKDVKEQLPVGFTVDGEGNIFFTIATLFKVYKITPEGKVSSFGQVGGIPGRFGVIANVAVDDRGNILVVDKLKCLVSVFDRNFNFLAEFGYRGYRPGNLIAPDDIAVDTKGRVYVSQEMKRGVSVYQLTY